MKLDTMNLSVEVHRVEFHCICIAFRAALL
jgi:hypothetical protein